MGQRIVLSDESLIMLHISPIKHGCSLKPARFDWFLVGDGPYEQVEKYVLDISSISKVGPDSPFWGTFLFSPAQWLYSCGGMYNNPPEVGPGTFERKDSSIGPQHLSKRKNHSTYSFAKGAGWQVTCCEETCCWRLKNMWRYEGKKGF